MTMSERTSSDVKVTDLQGLVITLRKYRLPIALATVLGTLLTMLYISALTPVYRATATLMITPPNENKVISIEELVVADRVSNEYFQTQVEVLKSRKLATRVVQDMKLASHWEYNEALPRPTENQYSKLVSFIQGKLPASLQNKGVSEVSTAELEDLLVTRLMKNVSIRPLKETNLVRVVVKGFDPQLSKKVADGYGNSFIDSYLDTKLELTNRASAWLTGKLSGMKQKLEESEARLLAYKERNGLIDLGGRVSGINERQIGVLTERLVEARRESRESNLLLQEIEEATVRAGTRFTGGEVSLQQEGVSSGTLFSELESLAVISGNTLVNQYRQAQQEAERELEELNNRYGQKHPRVVDAKSNLTVAAANLDRQIKNVVDSVRKRKQLSDANVRSIDAEIKREKQAVHSVGRKQIEMVELEREVEANRDLYLKFYNRAREADEAAGMGTANASVADPASVSTNPVFPRKRVLLLVGFALSLLLSSLAALFVERRRDTVQGVSDIVKRCGLTVLGVVPALTNTKAGKKGPVLPGGYKDETGTLEESFKTVRSTLYLAHDDCKVILVTSSLPGEGKSTIAANLAHAMSAVESVVLVEADMRRPGISRGVRPEQFGLSDYLTDNCQIGDLLHSKLRGVDFIPAGADVRDPLELLSSHQFTKLLRELRRRYDRVIIDSAPVVAVSDAMVIGRQSDIGVFVVKADSTHIDDVEVALGKLSSVDVKLAGAIISQVDMGKVVSYGGHYRYRGYYDQYGYGGGNTDDDTRGKSKPARGAERGHKRRRPPSGASRRHSQGSFNRHAPALTGR